MDGLTRENAGRLMRGELEKQELYLVFLIILHFLGLFSHALPLVVFIWFKKQRVSYTIQKPISYIAILGNPDYVKGKNVVVIGRSKIVGSPAAALFMWHHG